MVILVLRGEQYLTGINIASVTLLQELLHIIRSDTLKQFEASEQRSLVVRINCVGFVWHNVPVSDVEWWMLLAYDKAA
jgi:hypothetical protein